VLEEFLLTVAAGIVVEIVGLALQKNHRDPPTLEVREHSETSFHSNTSIIQGPINYEESLSVTLIRQTVFRRPVTNSFLLDPRLPLALALLVSLIVMTVLVLLGGL
jgi:hypothetical protein